MLKKIVQISGVLAGLIILSFLLIFIFVPTAFVDIYRGSNETTIFAETKNFPFKLTWKISDTDKYKAPDIEWSPDGKHVAYFDMIMEKTFEKEWALKIVNLKTMRDRTIFIGDYHTGGYEWVDGRTVIVYVNAGSGAKVFRYIDIGVARPVIMVDEHGSDEWLMAGYSYQEGRWVNELEDALPSINKFIPYPNLVPKSWELGRI